MFSCSNITDYAASWLHTGEYFAKHSKLYLFENKQGMWKAEDKRAKRAKSFVSSAYVVVCGNAVAACSEWNSYLRIFNIFFTLLLTKID